jgi:hypothetical protein
MGVREPSSVCPRGECFLFLESARAILKDSIFLRRVLEGEGRAWGSCAGAHRGVLSFGHFFGREGLLDESLWSRDPHLLEKRGNRFPTLTTMQAPSFKRRYYMTFVASPRKRSVGCVFRIRR